MCAAAISFARIERVIIGALDPKGGGVLHGGKFYNQPTCHWRPEVTSGLLESECGDILRDFFRSKR
jgi:tRNA(Arg) A34 adenosine deaminase TadA